MSNKKDRNYEVGRGKPPIHSRFKKGQSGNPGGRRKGGVKIADLDRVFDQAVGALMTVNDNGREQKITKLKALVTQTLNKGIKGHHPSAKTVINYLERRRRPAEEQGESLGQTPEQFEKEFRNLLDTIANNLKPKQAPVESPTKDTEDESKNP